MTAMKYNRDITELVEKFDEQTRDYKQVTERANNLRSAMYITANRLATLLLPPDAAEQETFHFWFGNRILKVTKNKDDRYTVNWRANGKEYPGIPKETEDGE